MSLPRDEEWTDPGSMDPVSGTHRGRRIVAALAVIALVGLASAFTLRASSLWRLPRLDPSAVGVRSGPVAAIPDGENALVYARTAAASLPGEPSPIASRANLTWELVPPVDRHLLDAAREPLLLWFDGTTMDQAQLPPGDPPGKPADAPLLRSIRAFALLGRLVALRAESDGEFESAWSWSNAGLRSSRQLMSVGGFAERMTGIALADPILASARDWAVHPNLNTEVLRAALADLHAIDGLTSPLSNTLRVEYERAATALEAAASGPIELARRPTGNGPPPHPWRVSLGRFFRDEPERSRRVLRLVWDDWLAVADLTPTDRDRLRLDHPGPPLYDTPGRPLSPSELRNWLATTELVAPILPDFAAIADADHRDAVARDALALVFAEELFRRDRGRRSGSIDELIGPYLKLAPRR